MAFSDGHKEQMINSEQIAGKGDEMLPECPIQNVRNSLMEKTGQKEERVYTGFDFFPTKSRRKQYMGLPSLWLWPLCGSRGIGFCGSLTQATAVSWRSMYHLIGRDFSAL